MKRHYHKFSRAYDDELEREYKFCECGFDSRLVMYQRPKKGRSKSKKKAEVL